MTGIPSNASVSRRKSAMGNVMSSLSTTQGPAMRKKGPFSRITTRPMFTGSLIDHTKTSHWICNRKGLGKSRNQAREKNFCLSHFMKGTIKNFLCVGYVQVKH